MFVRNTWYVAAFAQDVGGDKPLARTFLGRAVVLYRTPTGEVAALEDRCCHRFAPLSLGDVEADGLRCRYHGLKFDASGRCIEIPGQTDIPETMRVDAFPVVERHGLIWIWMGDATRADPSLIVDCHWHVDPDWPSTQGYLHYQANYQLICDNLLDFSHLTFVHRSTLANPKFVDIRPEIKPFERGLTLSRRVLDSPPSPLHRAAGKFEGNVDFWTYQRWWLPSIFENWAGSGPVGGQIPDGERNDIFQLRHFSLLTPETESTAHYFWIQPCRFPHDDPGMIEHVRQAITTAFNEDKWMIEAQQKILATNPPARMQGTRSDFALNQVRYMIRRLLDAEAAQEAATAATATTTTGSAIASAAAAMAVASDGPIRQVRRA